MDLSIDIRMAVASDIQHTGTISRWYEVSSKDRGTGIAIRSPEYLEQKILKENAIIAFVNGQLAGFCYIETFSAGEYVSNSGLIVRHSFRGKGLATSIKKVAFQMARDRYPEAQIFGITTSDVVMKINSQLGYIPVSFAKLTTDDEFWKGCSSCSNYDILMRHNKKMCLCTGMLAPSKSEQMKLDLNHMIVYPNKKTSQ